MAERSKELIQVGYFLSRFGKNRPPDHLNITKWKNAYKVFYNKLSEGSTVSQFEHSLKNSRDAFDGYFSETKREGWKADDGSPSKLTGYSLEIYNDYENLNEEEVFLKIESFISPYIEKEVFGIITNNDKVKALIENYKRRISKTQLKDEVYKWELVNQYRGRPNPEATDFYQEIKDVKFKNLIYAMGMAVINHLAKDKPEVLRQLFINLYDESKDLTERVKSFNKETLKIYRELGETLQHHQDERSIATYLTFHNPDKYTFYKSTFYKKYCKLLGIKAAKKNEKYTHYLKLIDELIEKYIAPDSELIEQVKSFIPDYYNGTNHKLLAQDILYQMLNKNEETNYWIFQGNPKVFDFEAAIADGSLDNFTVSAHKDKIRVGDRVIIWLAGSSSGCYALAEISSEPTKVSVSRDDKHWKVNDPNDIKAGIKITHNLFDKPILRNQIEAYKEFAKFKGGNQGSNFSATEEEYLKLLELATEKKPDDEKRLIYRLSKIGKEDSTAFYNKLEELVTNLELLPEDPKVCYNLPKNVLLGLTIGQKYALTISRVNKKNILHFMDTIANDDHWYQEVDSFKELNEAKEAYLVSSKNELQKTKKTGYEKSSSPALEKSIFDVNYRKYVFDLAFKNGPIKEDMIEPINTILYGPPGTGKTYRLKNEYFSKYTTSESSISPEKHFTNAINGCSWWQVIAIALIELGTSKVSDILNHKWVLKKTSLSKANNARPILWSQLQSHTIDNCDHVNVASKQAPLIFNKSEDSFWEILEDQVKELAPELYELVDSVNNFNPDPDKEVKRYVFTTFHQSFSYEDFIEGIKPIMPEDDEETKDLGYKVEDGIFKSICKDAENDPANQYAIFIDEINRGNVSAIFGELITLIEPDKRQGQPNEIIVELPYSKQPFSVPSNLDIYGTMNTADRSVEALDTALRRRFSFLEMMPEYDVIDKENIEDIKLAKVLKTMNDRIELLIDRDHTIGHSYFINISSKKLLADAFNDKIVPLLQEYFYGDYGKIGLVLGEGFVKKLNNSKIEFATFDYDGQNDFKTPSFVLEKMDESTIVDALKLLLPKKEEKKDN